MPWLLLLLGLITYLIVQRVSSVTRTPVWLLWLVAMTPAFIWSAWAIAYGSSRAMPAEMVILPFILCLILYWFLIQWGRISPSSAADANQTQKPGQVSETPPENQPELPAARPINKEEEGWLQNCFPWSVYYLQNIEYRPQAVICRGQLRTQPEVAYKTIRENIEAKFGDRFYVIFQENQNGKPFFALVPNPHAQPEGQHQLERTTRPLVALGLLLVTLLTTTLAGATTLASKRALQTPEELAAGLPYALALMAILSIHELGHYWMARRYKLWATLPYFIPVMPIPNLFPFGTFGAFIQIRSPWPDRKALFDVNLAGPLSGLVVALPLLVWGLAHSTVVPLPQRAGMFNFDALDPSYFTLVAIVSKLVMGAQLSADMAIKLHPVAIAGYLGVLVTALNLMPVGQLDGGHLVHAMFGQRKGAAIGQVSRFLLLALSLAQPHLLFWAILLFLLPVGDEPALNDVTELDNRRDFIGLMALGLLLLIILPTPRAIIDLLNL